MSTPKKPRKRTWKIRRKEKTIDLDTMTLAEFDRIMRVIEFREEHKKLERKRKRAKKKRTWTVKPGR
jgi:hypothetical protein